MLAVPADRLPAAIGDLDPGNRALLDLSLRRGVSDAEIGELLRKEPAEVARGRDAVLELLADALDIGGHDRRDRIRVAVAMLPDHAWAAPAPTPPSSTTQLDDGPEPEAKPLKPPPPPPARETRERAATARVLDDEHRFDADEPRRSRRGGLLAVLGLLAVVVALIAVLSGGDDDESEGGNGTGSQPAQNDGPPTEGTTEELAVVGGGKGSGTLSVTDAGATIAIRGLPDPKGGVYGVWLYDSIVNAKSLGTMEDGSGQITVTLPPDARDYRFLDVSLEPDDGNPNHSGDSVMRAPLSQLLAD